MALHTYLSLIMAFDTFIGNHDRSNQNLYYDKKTDKFFAIDLEGTFGVNYNTFICTLIITMLKKPKLSFTKQEIKGLILFRDTLKSLVDFFPPEIVHQLLDGLISESKIMENYPGPQKSFSEKINAYKKNISAIITEAQNLLVLLDKLISQYTKKEKCDVFFNFGTK